MGWNETPNYIPGDANGACYFCGGAQRTICDESCPPPGRPERLFRWDGSIDFEGFVVICETCISDLARGCGWETPHHVVAMRAEVDQLRATLATAEQRATAAEALAEALDTYNKLKAGPTEEQVAEAAVAALVGVRGVPTPVTDFDPPAKPKVTRKRA